MDPGTTIRGACDLTNSDPACFTASWYLVWAQIRYWGLAQLPIAAVSIIYEWLELANEPRLERLRTLFDAPLINVVNYLLQIVTSIYVCIAWIVRGGSLAVSFSSWSIETLFYVMTMVGYAVRWIGSKHKVRFVIQLHNWFDLLSFFSHFAISLQTHPVGGRERRSWLDFGFLRSYILWVIIDHLFTRYKHKTFVTQVGLVIYKACSLVFFAACVLFSLERLGDIPYTNNFILHVYKCSNIDKTKTILVTNSSGTDDFLDCTETWSFFSSIYFMFVTVSTVGYGDFSPKTVLGQIMVCIIIVVGIYTFANESAALLSIYGDQRGGRVQYNASRNTAHVIVTGNPSAAQMKDFIREFFHPDHEAMFDNRAVASTPLEDDGILHSVGSEEQEQSESRPSRGLFGFMNAKKDADGHTLEEGYLDSVGKRRAVSTATQESTPPSGSGLLASKWMKRRGALRVRETHIVILMRFDDDRSDEGGGQSFQEEVEQYVTENPRFHKRVFLIYGSPLRAKDLNRARLDQAMAVFFLPNKFANDGSREDAATVLRVLSVSQQVDSHQTPLFAMLVNSENRTLLEATGLSSENLVCADELRLGLMGLSCRCPGLSTLVSNLITSRSADLPADPNEAVFIKPWIREYVTGAANEIYSCQLAPHLHEMTFTQCAQRIHRQSDGQVLLIAVEYQNETFFNPGHWFRIRASCRAFLIAESVTALSPFSMAVAQAAGSSICEREPPSSFPLPQKSKYPNDTISSTMVKARENLIFRARRAQHNVERRLPQHVRDYVLRCGGSVASFQAPMHPPPSLIACGGHIVVCSNVANDGAGSRSISRLVSFLRPLRAPHIERVVPVVIVDSERFDPVSWMPIGELGGVYHVHGTPQRHQVLVSAGVYSASAIVVLAQGTATGYDDSKAIFNAILVNAALERSNIFTIIELRDVHNNKFLDPVPSFSSKAGMFGGRYDHATGLLLDDPVESVSMMAPSASPPRVPGSHRMSTASRADSNIRDSGRYGIRSSSVAPTKLNWWGVQKRNIRRLGFFVREFFLGSLQQAATQVNELGSDPAAATAGALESLLNGDDDTFFQERFMCGALFPSYVADDLLIQSFFNPSLNQFIRKILDGTSCFMLYDLPKDWRQGNRTYGELFAYMTSGIASALPIGLLRAQDGDTEAPHPYVYTSPATGTILHPDDKVFVIIDVTSIHRVANKIQRRFRNRKRPVKHPVDLGDAVRVAQSVAFVSEFM